MKKIFFFISIIFFFLPVFGQVKAASFSFDKSSYSVSTGQTVQVQINIDAGTDQVNGADAYINYDNSFLSVENIAAGSFFPTVTNDTTTAGKIYIAGLVDDPASPKTGSGTLAIITFKGLKDGTANLSFDCNNSKIVKNDANATNILQCSSSDKAMVAVGSGNSGSSDSNNSSNTSSNNQPTTLPKSGVFDNLINLSIPGAILFLIGGGLKLFMLK
jgi:hypothetical protein